MTFNELNRQPRVLCIDDDPAITAAVRIRLADYEVDVSTSSDGIDGLWRAVNELPDLIITDLRMPHGEGDYVVECLKGHAATCDIPVLVLTGQRDPELKRWMLTLGVQHYLQKPLRLNKLVEQVARWVELRPRESRSRAEGANETGDDCCATDLDQG